MPHSNGHLPQTRGTRGGENRMTNALRLCASLEDRLRDLRGTTLRRHSVFDAAANFTAADGHLLTFLADNQPMAVSSVQLPTADIRGFFGDAETLQLGDGCLLGPGLDIRLGNTPQVSPYIRDCSALQNEAALLAQLREALLGPIPQAGIYKELTACKTLSLPEQDGICANEKLAPRFAQLLDSLLSGGQPGALAEAAGSVMGYGVGLTPAADDFLLGLLAALSLEEITAADFQSLATVCAKNLSRTTDISAEMLYHGCQRRFSAPVVCIFDAKQSAAGTAALLNHGHSSGHDTLCGIYAGLTALHRRRKTNAAQS